jgi:hypothetical protein
VVVVVVVLLLVVVVVVVVVLLLLLASTSGPCPADRTLWPGLTWADLTSDASSPPLRRRQHLYTYFLSFLLACLLAYYTAGSFTFFLNLLAYLLTLLTCLLDLHCRLSFGVLTFFLNFIPTFGFVIAVVLPMPLIALNPAFPPGLVALAFIGPLVCGIIAKVGALSLHHVPCTLYHAPFLPSSTQDVLEHMTWLDSLRTWLDWTPSRARCTQDVLEPLIIGQRTALHPAVILLAIMLFGSVWGIVGMVLAVPVTAVVRAHQPPHHHHP